MYASPSSPRRPLISIGIGLAFGIGIGILQLGIALYNMSIYVGGATRVPDIIVLVLWMVSWFAAGLLAGRYTHDENSGVVAGLCAGLISVIVALAAPVILVLHRTPNYASADLPNLLASEVFATLPHQLMMAGMSVGIGFVASWLALRIFPRAHYLQQSTSTPNGAMPGMYRCSGMGIYIVLVCAALVLTYLVIIFPLMHILEQKVSFYNVITSNPLFSPAICGVISLCIYSFVASLLASRFASSSMQSRRFTMLLWMSILGSIVNAYMIIVYMYNDIPYSDVVPYDLFSDMVKSYIEPYFSSIPVACIILVLGAIGAILLGIVGSHLGTRRAQPQPKEEKLTIDSSTEVMEPMEQ